MSMIISASVNHRELTPEEVNVARTAVIDHLRTNNIDEGVTTAIVITIYDSEANNEKHLEIRGTTNPKLYRFAVPVKFKDGSPVIESNYFKLRPPYDPRRMRGRIKSK